jgi:hypothetical protein
MKILKRCKGCGKVQCFSESGIATKCSDCVSGFFEKETGQLCEAKTTEGKITLFICDDCKFRILEYSLKKGKKQ